MFSSFSPQPPQEAWQLPLVPRRFVAPHEISWNVSIDRDLRASPDEKINSMRSRMLRRFVGSVSRNGISIAIAPPASSGGLVMLEITCKEANDSIRRVHFHQ